MHSVNCAALVCVQGSLFTWFLSVKSGGLLKAVKLGFSQTP